MTDLEKKVRDKFRFITKTLIEKELTITTMESCTSGFIASLLTDTEGSSAIFRGAFVTYSNEAKIMQGCFKWDLAFCRSGIVNSDFGVHMVFPEYC